MQQRDPFSQDAVVQEVHSNFKNIVKEPPLDAVTSRTTLTTYRYDYEYYYYYYHYYDYDYDYDYYYYYYHSVIVVLTPLVAALLPQLQLQR